jgi:N-acetylmuramoyl-L-alanine amidase
MGGKHLWVFACLMLGPQVRAATSSDAYQAANRAYRALQRDPARRKFRHHWLAVARQFEQVAASQPKGPRAPEAIFTAAKLLEELSRISGAEEDLIAAVADYQKLCDSYRSDPKSSEAALQLARIMFERRNQPEAARRILKTALERRPPKEQAPELSALLRSLPREGAPSRALLDAFAKVTQSAPAEGNDARAEASPKAPPEPKPLPSRARIGELSLAEQPGRKVRRVVIDPGHGGHDAGAIGPSGVREKDVALAISRRLAEILEKSGLEVALTREDDNFVRLEDRAKFANDSRGDLFISIHCNSGRARALKGVETYSLNTSSNRYSIRLAARENASSERSISDLQYILADLATKANTEESSRLARRVQQNLVSNLRAKHRGVDDLGTKEALFYVLLGTRMPAILVETSYLSNPEEERRLSSKSYREEIARAIAAGVQEFLESRQQVAKVN